MSDTFDHRGDAWDSYDNRHDDDESFGDYRPRTTVCVRCGAGGLHWEETDVGFALYDARDRKHQCAAVKPSADDFDDLS